MKILQHIGTCLSIFSMVCGALIYNRRNQLSSAHRSINSNEGLTIIIPARNEAQRLPKLLQSIKQQQKTYEIIVMDDGSSDDTRSVARSYGASVYTTKTHIDNGWHGKSLACFQGAQQAKFDLFLFVDADVVFRYPNSINTILASYEKQQNRGLLSIQPYHQTYRFYESFSAIFNLLTVVGMNCFSTLSRHKHMNLAFGPVTLMNRRDYFQTQGHRNAQNSIIEGFALGQAFQDAKLPVTLFEGSDDVQFRMYEEGMTSLIQGWTKHFSVGANQTEAPVMFAVVMWLVGSLTTSGLLILSFIGKPIYKYVSRLAYLIYTLQFIALHRRVGTFSMILLTFHPILLFFFIIIFINSWRNTHVVKSVKWKGRTYHI